MKDILLITGGSGLVGKALKDVIDVEKYDIVSPTHDECDLTDRNETLKLFESVKPKFVIHLSAFVGGLFHNMIHKVEFFNKNILMNENVLEACHKNNVQRGIFCLSSCIFPSDPSEYPMTIEHLHSSEPHLSNESYSYAKRMLELQCRNYNEQYEREYICIVPVNIYGEGDNFNLEASHFIPAIIHKMYLACKNNNKENPKNTEQKNRDLYVEGNGNCLRQVIYSKDLAKIIMLILQDKNIYNNRYEMRPILCCDPKQEYFIKDIIEKIISQYKKLFGFSGNVIYKGTSNGIYRKTISSDIEHLFPDFEFTSLEEGLINTIKWFNENYPNVRK